MYKRMTAIIGFLVFSQYSFAENCPRVEDIKNNSIGAWKIYDSEEDKPLNSRREADFKKNVAQFSLAEWTDHGKKKGIVHCYYHDVNGSDFEAYLTKENFITPQIAKNDWYQVSGAYHCAAGTAQCAFEPSLTNTQFAKR